MDLMSPDKKWKYPKPSDEFVKDAVKWVKNKLNGPTGPQDAPRGV